MIIRKYLTGKPVSLYSFIIAVALFLFFPLQPMNAQVTYIQIISEPGALVYLDTNCIGKIQDDGMLNINGVSPGRYKATVVKGERCMTTAIDIIDKNERILFIDLLNEQSEDRSPVHRASKNDLLQYDNELISYGSFADERDGRQYKTIGIAGQTWMAENLSYTVPGESYVYPRDPVHEEIYGRLYTWKAAMDACPEGWQLPSDSDWFKLELFLGINDSLLTTRGWRDTRNPASLKSDIGWLAAGSSEDAAGFSAFPGGFRDHDGLFYNEGYFAYFWTSSDAGEQDAWYRVVTHDIPHVGRFSYSKKYAFSIRCVRQL